MVIITKQEFKAWKFLCSFTEWHSAEWHYSERHYSDCLYAECHYVECRYAECQGATLSHFRCFSHFGLIKSPSGTFLVNFWLQYGWTLTNVVKLSGNMIYAFAQ